MSSFHNIFCTSQTAISRFDIADHAEDSWLGDDDATPTFSPAPDTSPDWDVLEMTLPGVRRPIRVIHDVGPAATRIHVEEILTELASRLTPELADRIRRTHQIIGIEYADDLMTDDGWECIDQIEGFIAERLDGIVVTDTDILDADMNVIA